MKTDPLLEIFYKHLNKSNAPTDHRIDHRDEFIHNVVADYIFYLMNIGHIPECLCDSLEIDLKEEVLELYHKIIATPQKKKIKKQSEPLIELPPSKPRRFN